VGRDNDTNETNNEKIFNKGNNLKKGLVIKKSSVKGLGTIYYYFGHSASSENVGERGLSHMAEHLLCHSFDHLLPKITANSISYNAFTSDNHVVFYWTGLHEKLSEFESEFVKIFDFVPTKEQFENERNIILQEYTQYMADQNSIYQNINRKYYDYYGAIGCRPDIESITYEDFLKDENAEADRQIPEVIKTADFLIENNGTLEELHRQTDKIIEKINK
jgi:predicted Zn-dependent peptidase